MSGERQAQHLGEPPDAASLRGFPSWRLTTARSLVRLHSARRGPWYFANSGKGRFDLTGPRGTCYAALDAAVAFVEVFYGFRIVPTTELAGLAVSALRAPRLVRLADCTSSMAVGHLVTAEIATTADYRLTQRWAAAFAEAGFGGVRYWARHDTGRGHALALFGPAGAPDGYPEPVTAPLDGHLRAEVTRRYGIVFLDEDA